MWNGGWLQVRIGDFGWVRKGRVWERRSLQMRSGNVGSLQVRICNFRQVGRIDRRYFYMGAAELWETKSLDRQVNSWDMERVYP